MYTLHIFLPKEMQKIPKTRTKQPQNQQRSSFAFLGLSCCMCVAICIQFIIMYVSGTFSALSFLAFSEILYLLASAQK